MLPLLPGISFEDLYDREGLVRLDSFFLTQLGEASPDLHARLVSARRTRPRCLPNRIPN